MTRLSVDDGLTWIDWPDTKILLGTNGYNSRLEVEWPAGEPTDPLMSRVGTCVGMVVEVGQSPKVRYSGRALLQSVETWPARARFLEAPSSAEDRWRRLLLVDVAVVVPVLNRPHRAEPFMESLRDSTNNAVVYAVCGHDDEESLKAWDAAGAIALDAGELSTFSEKVNFAYQYGAEVEEPWLFLTGDDVAFHPGWLDELLRAAAETGAQVVGSNDLANPRSEDGSHAPHLLISRQYIAERGASWDGPGVVCHAGYRHMFVDDEIVTVAKQRGVFAFAREAVVEHLHPVVGKSEVDATYRLGWSYAEVDKSRFAERMREYQT